jgi:hypothetical protein
VSDGIYIYIYIYIYNFMHNGMETIKLTEGKASRSLFVDTDTRSKY